jgi:AraC family transcriptional activator of pobA
LRVAAGSRGELVELPEAALLRAIPATPLGDRLRPILRQTLSLPLDSDGTRRRIGGGLAELRRELEQRAPGAELAAGHHLSLALLEVWRLARAGHLGSGGSAQGIAERFVMLAGQHGREHWAVEDYCREIRVGRDRLGDAVRAAIGLSPRAYLHRELHRAARELLAGSGLQVAQVAFQLGFPDPAYFNRFFARMEGVSPGRFRRRIRARGHGPDESFAAWP